MTSYLLAGGGTAGHVNPMLAIADEIRRRDAAARIVMIGTKEGLESRLVPERGYDLHTIARLPFPRKPDARALRFISGWNKAVLVGVGLGRRTALRALLLLRTALRRTVVFGRAAPATVIEVEHAKQPGAPCGLRAGLLLCVHALCVVDCESLHCAQFALCTRKACQPSRSCEACKAHWAKCSRKAPKPSPLRALTKKRGSGCSSTL